MWQGCDNIVYDAQGGDKVVTIVYKKTLRSDKHVQIVFVICIGNVQ